MKDENVHTTLAFVHTLENGDRDFSFYRNPGADMMLDCEDINETMLANTKIFHFGSLSMTANGCFEATKKAISIAKENGAMISFDPNLREPLWEDMDDAKEKIAFGLSQCDILKISDNEIIWFTQKEDYDSAIQYLRTTYGNIKLLLVSLGSKGSRGICGKEDVLVSPFLQQNTIETTGAGDTFCGAVLHYVLIHGLREYKKEELNEMLTYANAGAALVTTKKGALRVMPTEQEITSLLER